MKAKKSFGCKKCGGVVAIIAPRISPAKMQLRIEHSGEVELSNSSIKLAC